jgi:hypothetical protein
MSFVFWLLWFLAVPQATYRHHDAVLLPDLTVTPGVATSLTKEQVCSTKWGLDERHVTPAMKDQVCVAYGLKPHCYGRTTNEIDHLISRELGGDDDIKNLWPQPYFQHPGAREKDTVENWLHKQVCLGKMSLNEAQNRIATDWYAVYLQMKKETQWRNSGTGLWARK